MPRLKSAKEQSRGYRMTDTDVVGSLSPPLPATATSSFLGKAERLANDNASNVQVASHFSTPML